MFFLMCVCFTIQSVQQRAVRPQRNDFSKKLFQQDDMRTEVSVNTKNEQIIMRRGSGKPEM